MSYEVDTFDDQRSASVTAAEDVLRELASAFPLAEIVSSPLAVSLRDQFSRGEKGNGSIEVVPPEIDARYRTLIEQIPAVVFMAFLDKGIGEAYVSPQIEAILGFTQEEWLNDPVRWYQQIHPDDKVRWSVEAAQLFMSGEPLKSLYRVVARDGRVVWFHCEAKMVRSDDGRPWFIHGVGIDISDLKRAEEAQKKSEAMLHDLFEFAPDTVVVIDHEGTILRVNAQVEKMFGYDRNTLIQKPIEVLMPSFMAARVQTLPKGSGLEQVGKRKDQSEFPVDVMLSPVEADEGSIFIGVIRDITRRKQAEKALQEYADRLKFLSRRLMEVQEVERRNIARELHDEIGQVLTGLKLTLEMGNRVADEIPTCLNKARVLVNELMERARNLSLDLRPAMLDDLGLLPALLWHIEHYTASTQVHVNFKHSGLEGRRFAPEVETSAYRIVQEALTNIARHANVSEATVRVLTHHQTLWIEIQDHGIGFDQAAALMGSETSGLAGMRERAVLLGGRMEIESHPGAGTRLTAELSIVDSPAPATVEEFTLKAGSK